MTLRLFKLVWDVGSLSTAMQSIVYASFKFAVRQVFTQNLCLRCSYITQKGLCIVYESTWDANSLRDSIYKAYLHFAVELAKSYETVKQVSLDKQMLERVPLTVKCSIRTIERDSVHLEFAMRQSKEPGGAYVCRVNGHTYNYNVAENFQKHPELILKSLD